MWPGVLPRKGTCASRFLAYAYHLHVRLGIPPTWHQAMRRLTAQPIVLWARRTARRAPSDIVLNALVVLGGAGCPVEPFASLDRDSRVTLPRDEQQWGTEIADPVDAVLRTPFWQSTWDMLDSQGRVLAQWTIQERRRPAQTLPSEPLTLTCDCGAEFSLDIPDRPLADPRPADLTPKWTFLSGRCCPLDVLPSGSPSFVRLPACAGQPEHIRVWD